MKIIDSRRDVAIIIAASIFVLIMLLSNLYVQLDRRQMEQNFQILWRIRDFEQVDRIQIYYNSNSYEIAYGDNHFFVMRDRLIPFSYRISYYEGSRRVSVFPHGEPRISRRSMRRLELTMRIAYYIGDERLFEVGVYAVPENMYLYSVEQAVSIFNDTRVVVVLNRSGRLFGNFNESVLNLDEILYPYEGE